MTTPLAAVSDESAGATVPAQLGTAGASLWRSAVAEYEISIPKRAALLQAAQTIDTLRVTEDAIRETARRER